MQSLFPEPVTAPRSPELLIENGLRVIDSAYAAGARIMRPLFSGGHDSLCACHLASQHPRFTGDVHHIRTGIGSKDTWQFVQDVCNSYGWKLKTYKSPATYRRFVQRLGFPGPGAHGWVYNWIKDRCVSMMVKGTKALLLTGCREQESVRRMGHVEPLKIGETSKKTGKTTKLNRFWTAPCHDWSVEEQRSYMEEFDLPRNPVKEKTGMSGECWCGAFASPGEMAILRQHCPDVAEEIDACRKIAIENGTHADWGTRHKNSKGLVEVESGQLCSSCDFRARAAGLLFGD